jgi:dienelactone hydrolase
MMNGALLIAALITGGTVTQIPPAVTSPPASGELQKRPIVSLTDAPPGTESFAVQWLKVAVPDSGVMLAAVARPSGAGPFPAVLLLHGTHGFAREYVQWAQDLARSGFVAVAACWFSAGGGPGAKRVTPPLPCPEIPPLGPGDYPQGLQHVDALVQATRALPGVQPERIALVGHSRGAGATLQYLLAKGRVQAAILHSSGYALKPAARAAEFATPLLIMHGTADGPADGGGVNTHVGLAREFEAALRDHRKPVEAAYYDGGGHNTFFTNTTQHTDELQVMIAFLRRHLGS